MSQPWNPSPTTPAGRRDPLGAPWPGLIPLRPLGLGDVFGAALRLVRTHAALLCLTALGGTLLGGASVFAVVAAQPDGTAAAQDRYFSRLEAGQVVLPPWSLILPLLVGALISYLTIVVVSGLAAALAGDAAIGRPTGARVALDRLKGRWPALFAVAAVVSVLVLAGLFVLVVPALIVLATLLLAAPVVVLEKAGPGAALGRSVRLSRGLRWRILGTAVLAYAVTAVISNVVLGLLPASATLSGTVVALALQALIAALTVPWVASVIALLYVDARIRSERLAESLVRSAAR